MSKNTNIKAIKFLDNAIYLVVLKIDNIIYMHKKNLSIYSQEVFYNLYNKKKQNIGIVNIYPLNILLIVIYT